MPLPTNSMEKSWNEEAGRFVLTVHFDSQSLAHIFRGPTIACFIIELVLVSNAPSRCDVTPILRDSLPAQFCIGNWVKNDLVAFANGVVICQNTGLVGLSLALHLHFVCVGFILRFG